MSVLATHSDAAPPAWRPPEDTEGTSGLRGAGPGRGVGGWRQGQGGQRAEPATSKQAPLVWRVPEGPEGLAAAAVGGGGAWPGFETTRRAKLAARTASGRAAAHGRTKQPGPTSRALRRPEHQRRPKQQHAARTARGRAAAHRHTQQPGTNTAARPRGGRRSRGARTTGARANRPYSPPPGSGRPV